MWEEKAKLRPNDFGWALEALRDGEQVTRRGWNGRHMWLALVPRSALPVTVKRVEAHMRSFIVMYTVQGEFVPWLASQTDILATDWEVVD